MIYYATVRYSRLVPGNIKLSCLNDSGSIHFLLTNAKDYYSYISNQKRLRCNYISDEKRSRSEVQGQAKTKLKVKNFFLLLFLLLLSDPRILGRILVSFSFSLFRFIRLSIRQDLINNVQL